MFCAQSPLQGQHSILTSHGQMPSDCCRRGCSAPLDRKTCGLANMALNPTDWAQRAVWRWLCIPGHQCLPSLSLYLTPSTICATRTGLWQEWCGPSEKLPKRSTCYSLDWFLQTVTGRQLPEWSPLVYQVLY